MATYFVTVKFTIEATNAELAEALVSEYLDEASQCVIDPYGIAAVYVDDVTEYVPEPSDEE